ncbi:ABC transporter substrate-binding protein [Candidatus Cetobacterium colombiensis]|uniref:ABC transporter substrate-binding protein n=1 Tax=Candidatus Cetobacterium colombiensis TaxID=3073100 RepID=A0ABU4W701_9FUSO|nr:ABC transporter substrate-binding protein [Candidatus Cetobacterium colombiensis]MDX8334970.1 ABC transporter substrate-binding protein [Candidatus Cetobacterium colombiensis]
MKRIYSILFFILTLSITIFSATINIVQEGDPRTFDPHFGNDGFSLRINRLIYSRLFEKNSNMENIPGLAKSYKVIDNKTIDFTLRDDVFFQNGKKLTAEDVKFSFERMKKSPRIAGVLPPIKEIIIEDDYHFKMILDKPFSAIIDSLTHPALSIVSKEYLTKNSKGLVEKPMGTGKYILESWSPGEGLVLERFENYFGKKPNYDKINIKIIPLATNRTIALETGEADLAFSLPPQDAITINKNPNLKFMSKPSYSYTYMGLNMKKEIFSNPDVRKGINLAIDKNAILETVLNGEGQIANSPVAKGVKGYNSKLEPSTFNKELATKLLKPIHGTTLTLATMSNNTDVQTAEIIAGFLSDAGIEVQIVVLDPSIYWVKTNGGEYDMFIGSWGSVTGDADYALYPTHHSSAFGAPGNRTFFNDSNVDKLLDEARSTLDNNKREKIYEDIQEIIAKNNSEVMLFYRDLNGGINNKIQNFEMYPIPIHDYSLGSIY